MRKSTWLAATAFALALTGYTSAQTKTFGPNPSQITNVPIDTSKAAVFTPQVQLTNPQPFSLTRYFKGLFTSSSSPLISRSQVPKGPAK